MNLQDPAELVRTQFPRLSAAFPEHAARFDGATIPGVFHVIRLDRPADSYFLVPVHAKGSGAFLLAAVHERTGRLVEFSAATVDDEDGELSEPLWPQGIPGKEELIEINRADQRTEANAKPRHLVPTGKFVWKPCAQSWSPLRPFVELLEGNQFRYLDVRGIIHDELTAGTGA